MNLYVDELMKREFARFDSIREVKNGSLICLADFIEEVRGPTHAETIKKIRSTEDRDKQKQIKAKDLPAVTISRSNLSRKRNSPISCRHTGLLQIDIDTKDATRPMGELRKLLEGDPHVITTFDSPSGGIKAVVPIPQDVDLHEDAWLLARDHFKDLGLLIDSSVSGSKSAFYLSYDPKPYIATKEVKMFQPQQSFGGECVSGYSIPSIYSKPIEKDPPPPHPPSSKYSMGFSLREEDIPTEYEDVLSYLGSISPKENADMPNKLWRLYNSLLCKSFRGYSGTRNATLVNFAVISITAISPRLAYHFMALWFIFTKERGRWKEPFQFHMAKFESELVSRLEDYPRLLAIKPSFTQEETKAYAQLANEDEQVAFRVMRNLGVQMQRKDGLGDGEFYLSHISLAVRLLRSKTRATSIIRQFLENGFIDQVRAGSVYTPGKSGAKATTYLWKLYQTKQLEGKND